MGLDTVLFFDEANTTDAIELIKEIMCDRKLNGETIQEDIKFIAACNPYKRYSDCIHFNHIIGNYCAFTVGSLSMHVTRHSDDMIEKLESAGLGFFIKGEETKQKLGMICYTICSGSEHVRIWTFAKEEIKCPITVYVQVPPPSATWCTVCWTSQPAWNHWCMTMEVSAQLLNRRTFAEL